MRIRLYLRCAPIFLASAACTNATGNVQGGELTYEAGTSTAATTTAAGSSDDAGNEGDAPAGPTTNNPAADCQPGGMYGDNTWTDLYQCYFGPTGPDSCAGQSGQAASCHASSAAAGGMAAWVCGTTSDSCYQGMTSSSNSLAPHPEVGTSDLSANGLYSILCTTSGEGYMPNGCPTSARLFPDDMARIGAWIQAGAQNN